jgi:hypothetical protein
MMDSYFFNKTPKNLSKLKASLILMPAKIFDTSNSIPLISAPFPPLNSLTTSRKNNSALFNRNKIVNPNVNDEIKRDGLAERKGTRIGGGGSLGVGKKSNNMVGGGGWIGGTEEGRRRKEDNKVSFHLMSKPCDMEVKNSRQRLNNDKL